MHIIQTLDVNCRRTPRARGATSNCQPDGSAAPISCLFARGCLERGGGACESLDDDGDCSESAAAAAADGSNRGTLGRLSGAPVSETKLGVAEKTQKQGRCFLCGKRYRQ